ncbi:hypothetical protein, partial [Streptomyces sp. P17]|uniref:hypothetical protein n=1 Tax=Streptomyces sp. P17 TaxID=3074716 RepID=UPI0028F45831
LLMWNTIVANFNACIQYNLANFSVFLFPFMWRLGRGLQHPSGGGSFQLIANRFGQQPVLVLRHLFSKILFIGVNFYKLHF